MYTVGKSFQKWQNKKSQTIHKEIRAKRNSFLVSVELWRLDDVSDREGLRLSKVVVVGRRDVARALKARERDMRSAVELEEKTEDARRRLERRLTHRDASKLPVRCKLPLLSNRPASNSSRSFSSRSGHSSLTMRYFLVMSKSDWFWLSPRGSWLDSGTRSLCDLMRKVMVDRRLLICRF